MNCSKCSKCCESVQFELHSQDHARWAELHGIEVIEEWDTRWARFPIKCKMLKNGKCSIYDDRPEMCKSFYCEKYKEQK